MLGVASAVTIAAMALVHVGSRLVIYRERRRSGIQTGEFVVLTVATVLIATIAMHTPQCGS